MVVTQVLELCGFFAANNGRFFPFYVFFFFFFGGGGGGWADIMTKTINCKADTT